MRTILTILLAVIGSSGVASVVVACLQRHWSKTDNGDARLSTTKAIYQAILDKMEEET